MARRYDIFLVCAPKDYNKIPYCLDGIRSNMRGFDNIYLCTPEPLSSKFIATIHHPVNYRQDMAVLPAIPSLWRYRPNWVYQQFIKLFQQETKNDWYLVVDCDTIINKPLPLFDASDNRPIWYISWEQNNAPYYEFTQKMFGFGRVYPHSFLADIGFYRRSAVESMLEQYGYTRKSFIEKSYKIINKTCYPSEADIYMGYINVCSKSSKIYHVRQLKNKCDAREGQNPKALLWSKEEIEAHIKKMKDTDYDTFAIHSWVDRSHNSWAAR